MLHFTIVIHSSWHPPMHQSTRQKAKDDIYQHQVQSTPDIPYNLVYVASRNLLFDRSIIKFTTKLLYWCDRKHSNPTLPGILCDTVWTSSVFWCIASVKILGKDGTREPPLKEPTITLMPCLSNEFMMPVWANSRTINSYTMLLDFNHLLIKIYGMLLDILFLLTKG